MQAPRLYSIALPKETYPFSLHPALCLASSTATLDFATSPLYLTNLSPLDVSRPATNPPTATLRIVHPALPTAIFVSSSVPSSYVTVSDVFTALHTVLSTPLRTTDVPAHRRADVLSYHQARGAAAAGPLRVVDLLEGASVFCGLEMDVARSNRMMGVIDAMQSLTWILVTEEPAASAFAQQQRRQLHHKHFAALTQQQPMLLQPQLPAW